MEMQEDTDMVNDILNELNSDSGPKQMPPTRPDFSKPVVGSTISSVEIPPRPTVAPMVQPTPPVVIEQNVNSLPPEIEVEYSNNDTVMNKILESGKNPLILACVVFLVFNPVTRRMLNKTLPVIFQSTSFSRQQFSILVLSIVVGASAFAINRFIK